MSPVQDHSYQKLCAQLAKCLSISLASARRKVEMVAMKRGVKDLSGRKVIAETLLEEAKHQQMNSDKDSINELDQLLAAVEQEENFMVED